MDIEKRTKLNLLFDNYKNLLTQTQKQALQLYLIEDLSISEIANILVTSRQAAYDAIKKSTKKLLKIHESLE